MPARQSKRWVFTLNNYTPADVTRLEALGTLPNTTYLVFGKEVASTGTPHLQGFIIFESTHRPARVRSILVRCHVEVARGTSVQASTYCKKDGDYQEFGVCPGPDQGKRTDWDRYQTYVRELGRVPTPRDLCADGFTSLYARYSRRLVEIAVATLPCPPLTESEPRFGWQTRVAGILGGDPSDRVINFVHESVGNAGKSWFCRYMLSTKPDKVQVLSIGKRDDLAYAIDASKSIFLFDIPRGQMEYLQYPVLEMLKDRLVFSPKYESLCKRLHAVPHVVIFSNEPPDETKMSVDRYNIIAI